MFTNHRNDPLVSSIEKVMKENQIRRNAVTALNEELGIQDRKELPHEYQSSYDQLLAKKTETMLMEGGIDPFGEKDAGHDVVTKVPSKSTPNSIPKPRPKPVQTQDVNRSEKKDLPQKKNETIVPKNSVLPAKGKKVVAEREMTSDDKEKENKLKKKYDAKVKGNFEKEYGDKKGKSVFFGWLRKKAMGKGGKNQIDEAIAGLAGVMKSASAITRPKTATPVAQSGAPKYTGTARYDAGSRESQVASSTTGQGRSRQNVAKIAQKNKPNVGGAVSSPNSAVKRPVQSDAGSAQKQFDAIQAQKAKASEPKTMGAALKAAALRGEKIATFGGKKYKVEFKDKSYQKKLAQKAVANKQQQQVGQAQRARPAGSPTASTNTTTKPAIPSHLTGPKATRPAVTMASATKDAGNMAVNRLKAQKVQKTAGTNRTLAAPTAQAKNQNMQKPVVKPKPKPTTSMPPVVRK